MFLVFTDRLEALGAWFDQPGWQKLQQLCLVLIT